MPLCPDNHDMENRSPHEIAALRAAQNGAPAPLGQIPDDGRDRLGRRVDVRMGSRIRGRVDATDVIREAYLDVLEGSSGSGGAATP